MKLFKIPVHFTDHKSFLCYANGILRFELLIVYTLREEISGNLISRSTNKIFLQKAKISIFNMNFI